MEECPFCGAVKVKEGAFASGKHDLFNCHNIFVNGELYDKRHITCYERQLARQADLMRQALERFLKIVDADYAAIMCNHTRDIYPDLGQKVSKMIPDIKSLIPALEKALEKTK